MVIEAFEFRHLRRSNRGKSPWPRRWPQDRVHSLAAMANRDTHVTDLCEELEISRATLYNFVTPDGKFTAKGEALLHR